MFLFTFQVSFIIFFRKLINTFSTEIMSPIVPVLSSWWATIPTAIAQQDSIESLLWQPLTHQQCSHTAVLGTQQTVILKHQPPAEVGGWGGREWPVLANSAVSPPFSMYRSHVIISQMTFASLLTGVGCPRNTLFFCRKEIVWRYTGSSRYKRIWKRTALRNLKGAC